MGFQSRWARVLLRCRFPLGGHLQAEGLHHVPRQGGALLVANHASAGDAWTLASVLPRKALFVSEEDPATSRFLPRSSRFLQKLILPRHASPLERRETLQTASAAIRDGHLVCLFAEGQFSRTGQMLPFGTDSEEIMKGLAAPIIPVGLTTARQRGWRWWRKAAWAHFGAPLPSTATALELRTAIQELASEAWRRRAQECDPLHRAFRITARRHPFRLAMSDARVPRLGFLAALAGTVHLARKLRRHWAADERVGILLPPSVAGALVNLAALLAGKITVNLNYTCSTQTIASCISQCGIRTVLTSQLFLEKSKLDLPCPAITLEDAVGKPRLSERMLAMAMGVLLPVSWLERALGRSRSAGPDEIATIVFSSGSTGEPKGVVLTHANVAANIAQLAQVYRPTSRDRMLGFSPFSIPSATPPRCGFPHFAGWGWPTIPPRSTPRRWADWCGTTL